MAGPMMRGLLAALIPRNRLVLSAGDKANARQVMWCDYSVLWFQRLKIPWWTGKQWRVAV